MKMKILAPLLLLAVGLQAQAEEKPEARMSFKVIDDTGKPLPGIEVRMTTFIRWQPGPDMGKDITDGPSGRTDNKGVVTLTYPSETGRFRYSISQTPGYYYYQGDEQLFPTSKDGKWLPWNPTIELVFKPILNPVPMYARRINLGMPAFNSPVGYDLMVGDWVAPYGKGTVPDFVFFGTLEKRSDENSDYTLTVRFSNKGDGIQPFGAPYFKGSVFKSPRYAPESDYLSEWVQVRKRRPNQPVDTNIDHERNYFFRVRTILDENGKIKSTLYGKIYGDFMQFAYYLNPTPNDRNMEFDPQKNLFKNLKSTERPTDP